MFSLRPPRNHTAIPVNENAVRQTTFSPAQVLRRAGFDNAEQILAALEQENMFVVTEEDLLEELEYERG